MEGARGGWKEREGVRGGRGKDEGEKVTGRKRGEG